MTGPRHIPLIILGIGHVGRAFLAQLTATHPRLAERYGVALRPLVLADSQGALFNPAGLTPGDVAAAVAAKSGRQSVATLPGALVGISVVELVQRAVEQGVERAIVVDCTAAQGMEVPLTRALEAGYAAVMANKRPLAGPWAGAQRFFEHPRTRFEATVGAGLPVIATLRYLVDTGDEVQRIEGALSGTLGYLCSQLEDGHAFSEIVNTAQARGYTEPDPREDLSGLDVARKALILARLAGWPVELGGLRVEPLYPEAMAAISTEEFAARLPRLDADFAAYMGAVTGVPRYMAEIRPSGGEVALKMVGARLAAQLRGTATQVSFWTRRYQDMPLTLTGPGGGMEVAAAAVLQDCLDLAQTVSGD
ncbi:MAG: homoserine dehydrogenase [Anaerolineae bacterium]|nr:homoserine dehydrogenase [Anaerolineae bacterium]